jgi:hypothetical protein
MKIMFTPATGIQGIEHCNFPCLSVPLHNARMPVAGVNIIFIQCYVVHIVPIGKNTAFPLLGNGVRTKYQTEQHKQICLLNHLGFYWEGKVKKLFWSNKTRRHCRVFIIVKTCLQFYMHALPS